MKRKIALLVLSCLMVVALLVVSCGPAVEEEEEEEAAAPPETEVLTAEEEEAVLPSVEEETTPPGEEEEIVPPTEEEAAPAEEEEVAPTEEEEVVTTEGEEAPPEEEVVVTEETAPSEEEPVTVDEEAATPATEEAPAPTTAQLRVHFINVGQGDSILVDLGEIEILIDGGGKSPGVTAYLSDYVDGQLEVMIATHPHADHIGGLIDVLAVFEVKQVWHNGENSTSNTYSEFMSAVDSENAQVRVVTRGDIIEVDGLTFRVLNPANLNDTTNNNSIVFHLAHGQVDFLFTGDAEKEAEGAMLVGSDMPVPDVEILKVGHHGSKTASSSDFLVVTAPEIAIYMAGEGNRYGHPHDEAISALCSIGAEIYGTDVHGSIVVASDGESYELQLEKQVPPVGEATEPSPPPEESEEPTPAATPESQEVVNVEITRIFYDGEVPRVESDEYVEITNLGAEPADLTGWVLKDVSEGYPIFTFPSYILQPGESVRVYTNEIHPEYGGFSFRYGKAIWNNSDPDVAALYDTQGQEVSRKSY